MIKQIKFIETGSCQHPEWFVNPKSGKFRSIRFPASVVVIEHATQGLVVFDTGYSQRFHEVTRYFPEKFYALATPVTIAAEDTALSQIQKMGYANSDVKYVVLSHFHADHIAGAADFTQAQYIYSPEEFRYFRELSRFGQVRAGFLNALLPVDLEHRMHPASHTLSKVSAPIHELGAGWYGTDLFGDESIMLVPLPGHTLGQTGLFIRQTSGENLFLVADAAWLKSSFIENSAPTRIAQSIFHDKTVYAETLSRLHQIHLNRSPNEVKIIPCHCSQTLEGMLHV
jgi:glyoxylase-like metal-dependent hydrolase (beta-lactamase superfamily II)